MIVGTNERAYFSKGKKGEEFVGGPSKKKRLIRNQLSASTPAVSFKP